MAFLGAVLVCREGKRGEGTPTKVLERLGQGPGNGATVSRNDFGKVGQALTRALIVRRIGSGRKRVVRCGW